MVNLLKLSNVVLKFQPNPTALFEDTISIGFTLRNPVNRKILAKVTTNLGINRVFEE